MLGLFTYSCVSNKLALPRSWSGFNFNGIAQCHLPHIIPIPQARPIHSGSHTWSTYTHLQSLTAIIHCPFLFEISSWDDGNTSIALRWTVSRVVGLYHVHRLPFSSLWCVIQDVHLSNYYRKPCSVAYIGTTYFTKIRELQVQSNCTCYLRCFVVAHPAVPPTMFYDVHKQGSCIVSYGIEVTSSEWEPTRVI